MGVVSELERFLANWLGQIFGTVFFQPHTWFPGSKKSRAGRSRSRCTVLRCSGPSDASGPACPRHARPARDRLASVGLPARQWRHFLAMRTSCHRAAEGSFAVSQFHPESTRCSLKQAIASARAVHCSASLWPARVRVHARSHAYVCGFIQECGATPQFFVSGSVWSPNFFLSEQGGLAKRQPLPKLVVPAMRAAVFMIPKKVSVPPKREKPVVWESKQNRKPKAMAIRRSARSLNHEARTM